MTLVADWDPTLPSWECCRHLLAAEVIYCPTCHVERPVEAAVCVARMGVERAVERRRWKKERAA